MILELLVYSGRPDPAVVLDDAAAGEIARRLATLPPSRSAFEPADRLGYRGLRLRGVSPGAVDEIEVSDGRVRVQTRDGRTTDMADAGRGFERWLLTRARAVAAAGERELVDALLQEIERR